MAPLTETMVKNDERSVVALRVVVHTTGPAGPTTSDNHWSIYLRLADDDGSVRMNMAAEYGNPTGTLRWSYHDYDLTNSALRWWDFPAVQGVKVWHIATLLYNLGRQNYEMSGGGSGCRYWV